MTKQELWANPAAICEGLGADGIRHASGDFEKAFKHHYLIISELAQDDTGESDAIAGRILMNQLRRYIERLGGKYDE